MKYPLRGEYDTAVRNINLFVYDSILKSGKPVMQKNNPNFLLSYNGGKAIVYEIKTNPKKYALKCWTEDLGDLKIRYKAIDEYLKQVNLPYFVDFAYNEKGILVNGQIFPIIRMEWIKGISFKNFISNNINNSSCIRDFAEQFLEMVTILHQKNISHGDLQHGNIMMGNNGKICLIDYDSLFVPKLNNEKDNIKGLPGYQHPHRNKLIKLSSKSDYFSELVIYLSLLILAEKPDYWEKIKDEERLIFDDKDLQNPSSSKIFTELKTLPSEIRYLTSKLENFCKLSNIENLEPLEDLVSSYTGKKIDFGIIIKPPNLKPSQPTPVTIDKDFDLVSFPPPKPTTPTNVRSPINDPWAKINQDLSTPETISTNSSQKTSGNQNIWDKIEDKSKDNWEEKFTQPKSINDNIWDKFTKSVSSIWDNISKWFNIFK